MIASATTLGPTEDTAFLDGGNFSVGWRMKFLTARGQDIEITVKPTRKAHGEMSVVMR